MTSILPPAKPRLSTYELEKMVAPFEINRTVYPLLVVGVRGYYRNTMGVPGINDRGIYDDAIFIHTPFVTAAYNGNTDPERYRPGWGTGAHKGAPSLKPGAWFVHQFDFHKNKYLALCQRAGPVTVIRDGSPPYEQVGNFGINIHCGGESVTGSEGCQTIPPSQWTSFISVAVEQAHRLFGHEIKNDLPGWKRAVIPYVLFEEGNT